MNTGIQYSLFLIKDLTMLIVLISIFGCALLGSVSFNPAEALSIYEVKASGFASGLALYQQSQLKDLNYYYGISPYNDYLVDELGQKRSLLDPKQATFNSTDNAIIPLFLTFNQLFSGVQNFSGSSTISSQVLKNDQLSAQYEVVLRDNSFLVSRHLQFEQSTKLSALGFVFIYEESDVIYDPESRVVLSNHDVSTVQKINEVYDLDLVHLTEGKNLNTKKVVIFNHKRAGALRVEANSSQVIGVNPLWNTIEVGEYQNPDLSKTDFTSNLSIVILPRPE